MNLGAKVAIKNWMGNFNIFKKSVHVPGKKMIHPVVNILCICEKDPDHSQQ